MSDALVTVELAAERLGLHPKTILRYIREGKLAATRIGKSYRIQSSNLDRFAGIGGGEDASDDMSRATCVVDLQRLTADDAQRTASFLQSAAATARVAATRLELNTAYDPANRTMKIIIIGAVDDVACLLEMLHLRGRP